MNTRKLSRRDFLHLSIIAAGSTLVAACGGNTNQSNNKGANGGGSTANNQRTPQQSNAQTLPTEVATQVQPANTTVGTTTPNATTSTGEGSTAFATQGKAPTIPIPTSFKESPDLTAQVKAGKLPKVAERLPKNPMVLKPVERVGQYGGTWRMGILGVKPTFLFTTTGYENLVRWQSTPSTR